MYRIDTPNSAATIQAPAAAGTEQFFQDVTNPGTKVSADWLNTVQEELINIIVAGGGTPTKPTTTSPTDANRKQVLTAIQELISAAVAAASTVPSGVILPFGGAAAPSGYLICHGQALSRTGYPALFAAIGTAYGAGDGSTTFNIPTQDGIFMRGLDATGAVDPERTLGSYQADAFAQHFHLDGVGAGAGSEAPFIYGNVTTDCPGAAASGQVHADNIASQVQGKTSTVGGATETRPKNTAFNFIIKT